MQILIEVGILIVCAWIGYRLTDYLQDRNIKNAGLKGVLFFLACVGLLAVFHRVV